MKTIRIFFLLTAFSILLFSCSKNDDDAVPLPVDRTESLKNTVWAGEYQYVSGSFTGPQPFSIQLAADGSLTWIDITSSRPGGTWLIKGDTISITFPNNTKISAIAGKDNWSDFKGGAEAGVLITQVNQVSVPDGNSLVNSTWTGSLDGSPLKLQFLADMKISYTLGTGASSTIPYTISGGGIAFNVAGILSTGMFYAVFLNNSSTMKGIHRYTSAFPQNTIYYNWATIKQ